MDQSKREVKSNAEVSADDHKYVFHSWSAQGAISPIPVAKSSGSRFWDFDGKEYLDFSSQLVFTNIGHQHPVVVAAIQEQAGILTALAPQHASDTRNEAAKRIVEVAGADFVKVFFTNGGADAIENAIRMCRIHTRKHKILSTYRSYHGNTGAAINATGDPRRFPNEFAAGHVHFWGPYLYRSAFWATTEAEECARALEHLEQTIIFEGPNTIAAILIESVPGTAGVLTPPNGYLEGVRALCDKYQIKWIADEVMAGFGRTGKWFAFQSSDVHPDLITFAKGVTSGYVPLGGVVISEEISKTFDQQVFPGGLTYMGHPLASAAAVATIDVMKSEKMLANATNIGAKIFAPGLDKLAQKHKVIGDIRGAGVFWGVDLVTNRDTREPLAPYGGTSPAMNELVAACKANGMMPFTNFNRIHLCPPCNISEADANLGLEILDKSLAIIGKYYTGQ
ncbi:MAG: aspartate aminotransferase family protein [SAR202 cluster bacterium]|jgi:taurine---2-oxoglutarate transaminase|nr:aspartate aminotransferase family protein [SAR202 cluster bacterium]|tara:strand:+ start:6393 stop:7745 length:1353 start_codon:yes stop_codon:yes gene_type:complete